MCFRSWLDFCAAPDFFDELLEERQEEMDDE